MKENKRGLYFGIGRYNKLLFFHPSLCYILPNVLAERHVSTALNIWENRRTCAVNWYCYHYLTGSISLYVTRYAMTCHIIYVVHSVKKIIIIYVISIRKQCLMSHRMWWQSELYRSLFPSQTEKSDGKIISHLGHQERNRKYLCYQLSNSDRNEYER